MNSFFRLGNRLYNTRYIREIYVRYPTTFNKSFKLVIEKDSLGVSGNIIMFGSDKDTHYYSYSTEKEVVDKFNEISKLLGIK